MLACQDFCQLNLWIWRRPERIVGVFWGWDFAYEVWLGWAFRLHPIGFGGGSPYRC